MQTQALLVKSAIQAPLFFTAALIGRRARSAADPGGLEMQPPHHWAQSPKEAEKAARSKYEQVARDTGIACDVQSVTTHGFDLAKQFVAALADQGLYLSKDRKAAVRHVVEYVTPERDADGLIVRMIKERFV